MKLDCLFVVVRATESLQQNGAALGQRIDALESQDQSTMSQISAMSSQITTLSSQINAVTSRIDAVSTQVQTVQSQVNALSSAPSITRCRLCFRETEGSIRCQGSRHTCSGWSNSPSWTSPFSDTGFLGGRCTYQWRLECA